MFKIPIDLQINVILNRQFTLYSVSLFCYSNYYIRFKIFDIQKSDKKPQLYNDNDIDIDFIR